MPNEMDLPALLYLGEWLETDGPSRDKLLTALYKHDPKAGAAALDQFASVYGVHRTLKKLNEPNRLQAAFEGMRDAVSPTNPDEAIAAVCSYTAQLKTMYGKTADSAATKFLWLRFRSPVRIYDSLAWNWLTEYGRSLAKSQDLSGKHTGLKALLAVQKEAAVEKWYPIYYAAWSDAYEQKRASVAKACNQLGVLDYLTRGADKENDLSTWIFSDWFHERVFDRYMILHAEDELLSKQ